MESLDMYTCALLISPYERQDQAQRSEDCQVVRCDDLDLRFRAPVPGRFGMSGRAGQASLPRRHLLPEVPEGDEAPQATEPSRLRVPVLQPPGAPHQGNDLRGVLDLAETLVLWDVPHGQHSMRYLREATRTRGWGVLPDSASDVPSDPILARPGRHSPIGGGGSGRGLHRRDRKVEARVQAGPRLRVLVQD